ncbi:MAG: HD-GYP domain-containing protein [Actinomycetota bacterium]
MTAARDIPPPAAPSSELDSVQRQLAVFAKELNVLYRQERERSTELQRALEQLREAHMATMKTLAFVVEAKDANTRGHHDRTHRYAVALAKLVDPELGSRHELEYGFLLHDIGKVAVPEHILNKDGPLTEDEFAIMKTHTVLGAQIVAPMEFLGEAVTVILNHHERWDGAGYMKGLKGAEIPIAARIFSVVDAFDAMTSDRPYRAAMTVDRALSEVLKGSGTQFDPEVVEAFTILVGGMDSLAVATPQTLTSSASTPRA